VSIAISVGIRPAQPYTYMHMHADSLPRTSATVAAAAAAAAVGRRRATIVPASLTRKSVVAHIKLRQCGQLADLRWDGAYMGHTQQRCGRVTYRVEYKLLHLGYGDTVAPVSALLDTESSVNAANCPISVGMGPAQKS